MKWFLAIFCFYFAIGCNNKKKDQGRKYDKTKDFKTDRLVMSDAFSNTAEFIGSEVFIRVDDTKEILVKISEIEFYIGKDSQIVVGKLIGNTTWGDDSIKGIKYDLVEQIGADTNFYKTNSFKRVFVIDSTLKPTIRVDSLSFRKVTINNHSLICPSYFKGTTQNASSISFSIDSLFCLGVLQFDCVNFLFCGGRCPKVRTPDPFIGTCNCPSGGACYFIPDGTNCLTNKCTLTCRNPFGWSAYCPCL